MRVFESKVLCGTLLVLFALSTAAVTLSTGSLPSFGSNPVLVPETHQQIADSPWGGPDPYDRDERA